MAKYKEGDRCKITAISKKDVYYSLKKHIIGRMLILKNRGEHQGGGFIDCLIEFEKAIKFSQRKKQTVFFFYMVKLKKV